MRLLRVGVLVVAAATLTACGLRDGGGTQRQAPARDTAARVVTENDFDHRNVVVTVSDLVKVVDGVPAMVLWERDYNSGELVEAGLAFYAQDNDGNVWHLGQYPEEYEDGKLAGAPAWITGQQGARAGLAMLANPTRGPTYSQGRGPAVDYTDRARVYRLGQQTCVAAGCYKDVLVTDEFALDEPEARQLKYYAHGVGNVRVDWMERDEEKEVLSWSG